MLIKNLVSIVVLGFATLAPSAFAETGAMKLDAVRSQQAEIRKGVQTGSGIYKRMSEENRGELLRVQAAMLRVIADRESASDLNPQQRTEVFNALERIQALINKEEDERLVCEMRATIGTNHKKRECMTVAQRRELRDAIRKQVDSHGLGRAFTN